MLLRRIPFILAVSLLCILSCREGKISTGPNGTCDGDRIYKLAFVSDRDIKFQYQLYIMNSDGTNQTRITQDSNSYYHPRFSPDGSKIVFYSDSYDTDGEIYAIHPDGSGLINLTNSPFDDGFPQFSPDGTKIVFTSDRDGNREIYIMNADGSDQLRLTNNEETDHAPQFSPDGSKILYYTINPAWGYNVHTMDSDGRNKKCLTDTVLYGHLNIRIDTRTVEAYWYAPQYSPDGSKIAFVSYSYQEQNWDIYIMNSDGSEQKRLTDTPGYNFNPRFFPDGKKIAFMTHRAANFDIFIMDLEGNNQTPIYDSTGGHALFAQFSPDGLKILLTDGSMMDYIYHIYMMNPDGSNLIQLTSGSHMDICPQFQPCDSH